MVSNAPLLQTSSNIFKLPVTLDEVPLRSNISNNIFKPISEYMWSTGIYGPQSAPSIAVLCATAQLCVAHLPHGSSQRVTWNRPAGASWGVIYVSILFIKFIILFHILSQRLVQYISRYANIVIISCFQTLCFEPQAIFNLD